MSEPRTSTALDEQAEAAGPMQRPEDTPRRDLGKRLLALGAFRRIGAIYVLILVICIFAGWIPDLFLRASTAEQIGNQSAVQGIVALSLLIPLAAGVFDLSVGATLGFTSILIAKLLASTSMSFGVAALLTLLAALGIGAVNAFVVVVLRIDSFIGTLATSSFLSAFVLMTSNNAIISSPRLLGTIQKVANKSLGGWTLPVFYLLALSLILWFVTEHTGIGRRIYATGFNRETARLSGVGVDRIRGVSLLVSSLVAGFAGILVTGQITSGSPSVGPAYLLPAYAMAFVGATQLRPGRFNAWGTVIAVALIGTGSVGLSLANVPQWAPDVYLGAVLIIAIGVTGLERRSNKTG